MKSLVTKIIGACLGLSLATGVGIGIASNVNEVTNPAYAAATTFTGSSSGGMSTTAGAQTGTKDDVTIAITNGLVSGEQIRIYKNATITISVPVNYLISEVVFTCTASGTSQYGPGCFTSITGYTYSDKTGTWTGSAQSISLKASSNQVRATSIAVTYAADSKTLESISIDGSLEKTSFVFGEAWNHKGLSVIGHYDDNSTAEITDDIHWSYNHNCTNIGITSLTITATVAEFTASYTSSVSVSKVTSPFINGVAYKMFLYNTSRKSNYYFIGSMNGYYGATTYDATSTDIVNVYFEPSNDGQALYFYAGNDTSTTKQYISISVSGTHYNFTFGTTVATWYYNGTTVCTYLQSADGIYGMGTYDNYVTFGASASYMTSNYFAQFQLVNALTAEDFATQFLDIVVCYSDGSSEPTYQYYYSWQALNELFDSLDDDEQDILKTADISGSDVVSQAMARYNLIVGKYGYTNFINRTIVNVSNRIMAVNNSSEVTIVIIVVIALAMSSVAAFYIFKKKKQDR